MITESNISHYKQLTEKSMYDWLLKLSKTRSQRRKTTILTGEHGMFIFDLAMQEVRLNASVDYSFTTYKKTRVTWLNLFSKHGLCKVKIARRDLFKFICYHGTKEIGQATDLKSALALYNGLNQ